MAIRQRDIQDQHGPAVVGQRGGRPNLPRVVRECIAHQLRELWRGIELKEVAKRLGYARPEPAHVKRLQRYQAEKNPLTPDLSTLIRISTAFNVGLDLLLFGQRRRLPTGSPQDLNATLKAVVTDELRRRYDYHPDLIEEVVPEDFLNVVVEDWSKRIKGFRATASGTDDQRRFELDAKARLRGNS